MGTKGRAISELSALDDLKRHLRIFPYILPMLVVLFPLEVFVNLPIKLLEILRLCIIK